MSYKTKNKIIKLYYFILFILYLASIFKTKGLPPQDKINKSLLNDPIQTGSDRENFEFAYRGKNYLVKPQADYVLWGLVVSQNNIGAWYNYYHDENSVNLKDVCVVWGENIRNGSYIDPKVSYSSGEWTCYVEWFTYLNNPFYINKLSNNHLLTADPKMQKIIRQINIGDQIYIKGALVDYQEKGSDFIRSTSLSREDNNKTSRSGGACEVFYVDDIEILKSYTPYWNGIKKWTPKIFIYSLFLQFIIFLFTNRKKNFIE